jgi:TRAP-type C4-dicarboxylate transport system substrate-binding protein
VLAPMSVGPARLTVGAMRPPIALLLIALAALPAACDDTGGNKAGGETVVLRLATIDSVNNNGQSYGPQAFVDGLAEVSGDRLKVEITETFGDLEADAESKLVEAIAAGEIDGGWPSTRSFAEAGIRGLEVVEAPMTITNYEAEKQLVAGPVGDELLARLDGSGVVGLGLAVGPMRRPFAAGAPLLEPADWEGARFRAFNSPVQRDAILALGGRPANVGIGWADQADGGSLRGAEFDIPQYAAGGFTTEAGNVTANVVLWPKVFVLSISRKRWEELSRQQRAWVRAAAERAVRASLDATYDETTPAVELCESGARFADASPDQVKELRNAVQPVLDRLAADPRSGALLKEIEKIAAEHPQHETPAVPGECRSGTSQDSVGSIPDQRSKLPDGVYRVALTPAEVEATGESNEGGTSGTWTLTLRDGTYELRCKALADPGKDCGNVPVGDLSDDPLEAGDFRGSGATAFFVDSLSIPPYRADWEREGETLTFDDYAGEAGGYLVIEPWRKIG